ALNLDSALGHGLDQLRNNVASHGVVETPPRKDDFGVIADALRLVRQVIRVNANAMPAHQSRPEWQKIPFCPCSFQYCLGVNAQTIENEGQLVDQGDIDVPLSILYDLGGFSHTDGRRFVGAGDNDVGIQAVHKVCHIRRGTRGDLPDVRHAVVLVAGVDPLGAVAGVEVLIEAQAGHAFQYGDADFLCSARVYRRFVNDNITPLQDTAYGFAGSNERREVRLLVLIDGCGHRHNEYIGLCQ